MRAEQGEIRSKAGQAPDPPRRPLAELRALVAQGPPYPRGLLSALRGDTRSGARMLYGACQKVQKTLRAERKRLEQMFALEREVLERGFLRVAGVDEAGRGPFAGPIVAAAVVLRAPVPDVNDSKQLDPQQRAELYDMLLDGGHAIGIGIVDAEAIDKQGIQTANYRAMAQAVAQLEPAADFLLIDGFPLPGVSQPQQHVIKGDARSLSIAAASIIAKVTRDRMMVELDAAFPGYGFARHKGYGTPEHYEALKRLGPCPIHRRSWAPVDALLQSESLLRWADEVSSCD